MHASELFWHGGAIVLLPLAAWLAFRCCARAVESFDEGMRGQAAIAGAAAAAPGAVLIVYALSQSLYELRTSGHTISGSVLALAVGWSAWRLARHAADVRRLIACTAQPSKRLAQIAAASGLRARELPVDYPICMLAGLFNPVLVVSRGTLRTLDDAQLMAALLHERAHARHAHALIATVVDFFTDAAFFVPTGRFRAAHRRFREIDADREAALSAGTTTLAAALIALAKAGRQYPMTCSLADADSLGSRLAHLLAKPDEDRSNALLRRSGPLLALAVNVSIAAFPIVCTLAQKFMHFAV